MTKLFVYPLNNDKGFCPNSTGMFLTMAVCNPYLRQQAKQGDWIVGLGARRIKTRNGQNKYLKDRLIFAMQVTSIMDFFEYDQFCKDHMPYKIPDHEQDESDINTGDCIYDYSDGWFPVLREGARFKPKWKKAFDKVLMSEWYYYSGEKPLNIPFRFSARPIKKRNYKIIKDDLQVGVFENWIEHYIKSK